MPSKRTLIIPIILLVFPFTVSGEIRQRPGTWATSMIGTSLGNFYKIDDKVYRSAQPKTEEMKALERYGIKEILNLRHFHSDKDEAADTDLMLHHVNMKADNIKDDDVTQALKIIKNAKGPVLIHCWHGSDRTGTISAMYRIIFQNWSKKKALDELENGGYGFHAIYKNIPEYIQNVDIEKIRDAVFDKSHKSQEKNNETK